MSATLVVKDPKTGKDKDVPLVRNGRYLQAAIGKQPFPAADVREGRSSSPAIATLASTSASTPSRRNRRSRPSATMTSSDAGDVTGTDDAGRGHAADACADLSSSVDPALIPVPIPETVPEMLAQLRTRTDQIRSFIDKGAFAAIYVPAFQAKDLALALDEHKTELPDDRQRVAVPGNRAAGALGLSPRCVRRPRQQTADPRGLRSLFLGGEGHRIGLPGTAMTMISQTHPRAARSPPPP